MASAIFKIMAPAGAAFQAVPYSEKKVEKGSAELIYFNNFGPLEGKEEITKEEFQEYLKAYSERNKRVKYPVFHAACSCKGDELTHEELKDIALEVMEELGYTDNPLLIYAHNDTDNNHVHIVTSRVSVDGAKINDSFEKKRANKALNRVINRNPEKEFELALRDIMKYSIGTKAQFYLLFEQKGYDKRIDANGDVQFFKHGKFQGSVLLSDIEGQIKSSKRDKKVSRRVFALVDKYRKQLDGSLISNKENKYTDAGVKYSSELTKYLHKVFGLEFVFFSRKGNKPYGYTIIDHKNKTVLKGSEVMAMRELIANAVEEGQNTKRSSEFTRNTYESNGSNNSVTANERENNTEGKGNEIDDFNISIPDLGDLFSEIMLSEGGDEQAELPHATKLRKITDDEDEWKRKRRRKFRR